jgi:hypothetical protein
MVDGVEVINANNVSKWNLKCAVLGFNLDRAMVGGSDGHALNHMGRAVSYAQCPRTRHDFLDAVVHKANQVAGKEITLLHKADHQQSQAAHQYRATVRISLKRTSATAAGYFT